ncbi:MAG: saccharopine dehydrogenase NADP-binding domain-containing protein [Desulfobacterales bacterium]|nr:saccharopine dehydrogenase NADP-binding domain-containing protein [Desulfobacterales bacterium]
MKVVLMGSGGQGGPCASVLVKDPTVTKIKLADANIGMADKVKVKINSDKIQTVKVDATNIDAIVAVVQDSDIIIDMMPVWLGPTVMRAALKAKKHYVSTSFDEPYLDQLALGQPLALAEDFKAAGLSALLGCGLSPGFINVMTRYYTDTLDTVKSIKLRLGKTKTGLPKYNDVTAIWNPGWSPRQALLDCSNSCYVFRNGKFESLPPYTEIEEYTFPKPVGDMLVCHHTHEEVTSLPYVIKKGIEYCDYKYYIARQAATFVAMGMTSQDEIEINGTKIKPIDFLLHFVPKPGNAFLEEDIEKSDMIDKGTALYMVIEITGIKKGEAVDYVVNCPKLTGSARKLHELFGTSQIGVALPAVIGAKMVLEGQDSGILFPEHLDPRRFIELFLDTGIPYKWEFSEKQRA